jgi:hypothetical protein
MKVCFAQNENFSSTETRITYNVVQNLKKFGVEVLLNECTKDCDFIVSLNGLSQYRKFNSFKDNFPHIKTIMYVWDMYPWTDYSISYNMLKDYDQIWVPSNEVILRLKEFYDIDPNKCKVIKAYAELYEAGEIEIENKGYVYHFARKYKDHNLGFCEVASKRTQIPLISSRQNLSFESYKENVLKCSFLVLDYMEASTGGLTMLEGYYYGKDVLFSDSLYQGGKDYFGDRAYYFKDGDIDDYVEKFKFLYEKSFNHKISDYEMKERKQFITDNYIIDVMTKNVFLSLKELNG